MAPFERPSLRPQRGVNLVLKKEKLSLDDLVAIKLNTGMEAADRWLDELLAAGKQYPDTTLDEPLKVLAAWDRSTDTGSRGALLFMAWFGKLDDGAIAVPWNEKDPFNTPRGLKDPQKALALLHEASIETQHKFGRLDITYGELFRYRINGHSVPGNGGPGDQFGIYRTMYYSSDRDKVQIAAMGDSYVAVVEFAEKPIAKVCLSYGNATQKGNKHLGDQLDLMSAKKLRPALLTREEVEANLEERE